MEIFTQLGKLCYNYKIGIDQNRVFRSYLYRDAKTSTKLTLCMGTAAWKGCSTAVKYLTSHRNFGSVLVEDYRLIIKIQRNQPTFQFTTLI